MTKIPSSDNKKRFIDSANSNNANPLKKKSREQESNDNQNKKSPKEQLLNFLKKKLGPKNKKKYIENRKEILKKIVDLGFKEEFQIDDNFKTKDTELQSAFEWLQKGNKDQCLKILSNIINQKINSDQKAVKVEPEKASSQETIPATNDKQKKITPLPSLQVEQLAGYCTTLTLCPNDNTQSPLGAFLSSASYKNTESFEDFKLFILQGPLEGFSGFKDILQAIAKTRGEMQPDAIRPILEFAVIERYLDEKSINGKVSQELADDFNMAIDKLTDIYNKANPDTQIQKDLIVTMLDFREATLGSVDRNHV